MTDDYLMHDYPKANPGGTPGWSHNPPPPPYAGAQPPHGAQYAAPPPYGGGPRPVRPRLLWIFLSWALFLVLLIAGVGGFAGGLFSAIGDVAPSTTFSGGQAVNVTLDPADKPAIYAAVDQPTDVRCQVGDGSDPQVTLTQPTGTQTLNYNGTNWEMVFEVGVPRAGSYQVACEGDGVRFGVGRQLAAGAGALVGGTLALLALPTLGFLAAVVVTIVVLVRRSSARRRMA